MTDHKLLKWTHEYELGVEDIDLQHHYFVNLINKISQLILDSNHQIYKSRLISELNAYARFHFTSEENMMLAAGYQGLGEHKNLHRELLEQLSEKEKMIDSHAGSQVMLEEVVEFLADWFAHHTLIEDKKFSDFLNSQ